MWCGLIDLGETARFIDNNSPAYFDTDSELSIQQAYDSSPPCYSPFNQFNLLNFQFMKDGSVATDIIKNVACRYYLPSKYKIVNNDRLSLDIQEAKRLDAYKGMSPLSGLTIIPPNQTTPY